MGKRGRGETVKTKRREFIGKKGKGEGKKNRERNIKKRGRGREKENSLTTPVIFWRLRFCFENFYATY